MADGFSLVVGNYGSCEYLEPVAVGVCFNATNSSLLCWGFLAVHLSAVKSYCEGRILASLPDSLFLNREEGFVLIKEHSVPGFCKGNFAGLFALVP